ncbi:hypothetical protein ASPACDRAFT_77182 [Aspergillus aculeatus ATCC 16872]|uniref:Uncharacterized protein n=1 Tax=Aspergillus aculeatus (strain ATCC 16872 / CBS 172.66 / WB 5094) TaxID=690307 RepID=A0A1L9WZX7_ASPA1|nr:uncharacterized protein ASPACDRAFT_77182 [Aspergillus aculeatus ATCC 16872]OJK01438.1 hypothetical protein ASPACDRAFT_77182 [Aspergillus aculeatus ATCC 16872]
MVLARPQILRASARALGTVRQTVPTQQFARRTYAQAAESTNKSSDLPWLIGSLGLGIPGAYYLLATGPKAAASSHDTPDTHHHGEPKGKTSTSAPIEKEESASAQDSAAQPDRDAEQKTDSESRAAAVPSTDGKAPSEADEPSTRKEAGNASTISGKQEGISNATTDHPHVNEPGKSVKGEGETETAKVKGTVSPDRPQQ